MTRAFESKTDESPHIAEVELTSGDGRADVAHGSVYFIGTATILIRYAGFTILTDPNFLHKGEYVRLGYGLRSRRLTDPAIPFEALPPYDLKAAGWQHRVRYVKHGETYNFEVSGL